MAKEVKVLIIGSGPAGYTAAIYAARAGLKPVLYTGGQPGGQLTTTNDVENFPGYPEGINGPQMMMDLQKQAERFGTEIHYGLVTSVDFSGYPHKVMVDEKEEVIAESVIIATGATAKYLGLPSEQLYYNKGVSACAVCDGYFYRGKEVAVVGAGDSAAEEATYLSKLCTKVHLIVRRDEMRASKIMQQRVFNTPNIEIHWNTETEEVIGDDSGGNSGAGSVVTVGRDGRAVGAVANRGACAGFPARTTFRRRGVDSRTSRTRDDRARVEGGRRQHGARVGEARDHARNAAQACG